MSESDQARTETAETPDVQKVAAGYRRALAALRNRETTPERKREVAQLILEARGLTDGTISAALTQARIGELNRLSIEADLEALRLSLGYDHGSAPERLLIDHILLCHLRVYCVEQWYANAMAKGVSTDAGMYWERKMTAVQHRYLRAIETLARVRKLLRPTVQVNIAAKGGQQVVANAPGAVLNQKPRMEHP